MKSLFVALMWTALNYMDSDGPSKVIANTKSTLVTDKRISPEAQAARQTVVSFLNWYKNHIQEANQIPLVN